MTTDPPPTGRQSCADCQAQTRKGPMERPHAKLLPIAIRVVGPAGAEWVESMYLCDACGSRLQRRLAATGQDGAFWVIL